MAEVLRNALSLYQSCVQCPIPLGWGVRQQFLVEESKKGCKVQGIDSEQNVMKEPIFRGLKR